MSRDACANSQAGFTLVETLVSLTLLAVLASLALLGYATIVSTWRRTESRDTFVDNAYITTALLQRLLSRIYPAATTIGTHRVIAFQGTPSSIDFFAPLSQAFGTTAIVPYRLYALNDGTLHLASKPEFMLPGRAPDDSILVSALSKIEFSYFGPDKVGDPSMWRNSWGNTTQLPDLIAVHIELKTHVGIGLDVVVEPRLTASSDCSFDAVDGRCRIQ